ncbi:MAG: enolase C-terminal domain-like protein [Thermomicrobiales bacterium]
MKIVEMRVTPIAIADPPLLNAAGLHAPYALRTIVELVSEDGLSGAGEAHGGERTLAHFEHAKSAVVGQDAFNLARLWLGVAGAFDGATNEEHVVPGQFSLLPGERASNVALRVYGAIEVAALDLIGKATGRPVCDLLGGRVRDEVPFSAYLFYKRPGGGGEGNDVREDEYGEARDPDGVVRQAKAFIDKYGFGSIKLKAGVYDPDEEVQAILAMRDAFGPDVPLRIDPNGAWTVETSIKVGTALAGALEYFEDPTPGVAEMSAVRKGLLEKGIDMPLATNGIVTSYPDIPPAVAQDAVQVILGDHHYWGGPRAVFELGRLCQTFGIGLSMHSNSHVGVSLLAMTHLGAATPHLAYACDTHYPWQHAADEILAGGRVPIVNGSVRVPDGPGLGAEIDQDSLARGKERYERAGYRKRDDEIEMQKYVDPTWKRMIPRW